MSLERIEITPFAALIGEMIVGKQSGTQIVARGAARTVLYWANGELVFATTHDVEDSLVSFLVRKNVIDGATAAQIAAGGAEEEASRFQEVPIDDPSRRQPLMREWLMTLVLPLFSLEEGTAAFSADAPLDPMKRIFLPSMPAFVLEGVRSILSGLILRRALGDLSREIVRASNSPFSLEMLPLTASESAVVSALSQPMKIEDLLKKFAQDSGSAARTVIALMALGIFTIYDRKSAASQEEEDTMKDLMILASIGPDDEKALRVVRMAKALDQTDHYRLLDVPRAATRPQIILRGEEARQQFNPTNFHPAVREYAEQIQRRIEEAAMTLRDPIKRAEYDRLLAQTSGESQREIQRKLTQRIIAEQNYSRAQELALSGDYHSAIVLLKQAVNFAPLHGEAWYLLGCCQERNPRWRRDAVESFQKALSINPNEIEVLVSLGDLYRAEGMASRAQSCYEDALRINPDHAEAKGRLKKIKG